MVDGILTSSTKSTYELPSQADLIRRAFAGDDVEDDFEKDKEDVLNEENPEPEKPILLPGWGQWTHIQKKKGLPSWMVEEHESAKKKRDEVLIKRKDANLKHVIISEKLDKKVLVRCLHQGSSLRGLEREFHFVVVIILYKPRALPILDLNPF